MTTAEPNGGANGKDQSVPLRLRRYYYTLEIAGVIITYVLALTIIAFPSLFTFLPSTIVQVVGLIIVGSTTVISIILYTIFKKPWIFNINRIVFLLYFIQLVYFTGGPYSPFAFMLLFPVVASAAYLNIRATKQMSILMTVMFTLTAYAVRDEISPAITVQIAVAIIVFAVLAYMTYRLVSDTLRQRFEKEETAARLSELVKLDMVKSDFLNVTQHQLRTPLSGVRWALETVGDNPSLSPEIRPLLRESVERVDDALAIVNKMLTAAEMKGDALVLKRERFNFAEMIRSAMKELNYLIIKNDVSVSTNIPDEMPICADRGKLYAACLNIIDNSFKYSPHGSVEIKVEQDSRNDIILLIKDTGIGISDEDKPFIFERFYRGKNAVSVSPNESGVGLYSARKIFELHGGTVSLDSTVGQGTTVTAKISANLELCKKL